MTGDMTRLKVDENNGERAWVCEHVVLLLCMTPPEIAFVREFGKRRLTMVTPWTPATEMWIPPQPRRKLASQLEPHKGRRGFPKV